MTKLQREWVRRLIHSKKTQQTAPPLPDGPNAAVVIGKYHDMADLGQFTQLLDEVVRQPIAPPQYVNKDNQENNKKLIAKD